MKSDKRKKVFLTQDGFEENEWEYCGDYLVPVFPDNVGWRQEVDGTRVKVSFDRDLLAWLTEKELAEIRQKYPRTAP